MANVFDLYGKISIDTSGFLTALSVAKKAISVTAKAVTNFAKSSVQTGMTFDKSMAQVAATMGKSVDEIQNLREFAQKMGSETAFSASQSADALNYMALAGYDAEKSMQMLPNVLNLTAASTMDLARASDMVTDTQTAFGITIERTTQMVDEMAKAASTGNTSVEQLGDAFLVVGGLAQELNGGIVSLSDGTTATVDGIQELEIALTGMANAGIKGSEAGTHMRNMLLKLSSPSDAGAKQMEALGVSVFDTEGKMRSLSDIFSDFSGALGNLTQEEKIQAISDLFNARDIASAEALLNAVEQDWDKIGESILGASETSVLYEDKLYSLKEAQELFGDSIYDETKGFQILGAAEAMAKTQLDNLAGDVTYFKSALEGIQIALSDKLTPTLRKFVQFGTSGLSKLTTAFKEKGLKGAMDTVGEVISELAVMLVEMTPDFLEAVSTILSAIGQGLLDNLPTILNVIVTVVQRIIQDLGRILPALMKALPVFINALMEAIDWDNLLDIVINVIEVIADALIDVLPLLTEAVLTLVEKIVEFVLKPETLSKLVELCAKVMIAVSTALLAAAPKLLVGVGKIIKVVVDYIINTDWTKLGQDLMDNIQEAISKAAVKLSEWWDGWSQQIAKYAVIAYEAVIKKWSEFGQFFVDLWNSVVDSWNWFWDEWRHGCDTMWDNVVKTFQDIGDFFKGIWDSIVSTFTTVGTQVGEAIGGAFKTAINAVIGTVEGALNAIPNAINGMIDTINNLPGVSISAIPTVTLPRLAQGGVLKKGQVGFLEGDGDEAVVPLSQNTEWLDKVADRLNQKSSGGATYNFYFSIDNVNGNREDMEENAELLMQIFTEKMARQGVVFA